jgi:Protein of unknown function (DUF3618)
MATYHSSDEIRKEIELTKAHMGTTLAELESQLLPIRLAQQARDAAVDRAGHLAQEAQEAAQGVSVSLRDLLQKSPAAASLLSVGLDWLRAQVQRAGTELGQAGTELGQAQKHTGDAVEHAREGAAQAKGSFLEMLSTSPELKALLALALSAPLWRPLRPGKKSGERPADHLAATAQRASEQMRQLGEHLREGTDQPQAWAREMLQQNPLAVAALVLALGALIGLVLPPTEAEGRLLGELRERVLQEVQDALRIAALEGLLVVLGTQLPTMSQDTSTPAPT